ncbi:MAG: MFS transporter [Sandaracinaceae bacterium]|nr:MFS transporter [Sandaracinaceae bacterium]
MASSPERFLTGSFALVFAANFFHGLAIHPYLHLPGLLARWGATPTLIGLVFGMMSGAAIVVRPFAGRVMDGYGRRGVMLAGGVVHVAVCLLYTTVWEVGPWLFAVRCLQGVAIGALFSSLFTYAADIVPAARRMQGIALFGVSGMLPMSLGGLLGDWALARWDYTELFMITAALASLALLFTIPLPEPERSRATGRGFFGAAMQKDLLPVWFVGSMFATALAGIFAFLKGYTEDFLRFGSVGVFFTSYTISAIVLRVGLGWLPDRVGAMRVYYPSMALLAIAMVVLARATSAEWIAVAGALAGIGHGYAFPILSAIAVTRAHPADRGSAMSLFTAIFDAGILFGSPVLGWIVEVTDYRTMYLVAAALPVVGTAIFHVWDGPHRRAAGAPAA